MNNEEERSNNAKPNNPGADSNQTQAAKASGNGNRIGCVVSRRHSSGRKKQRCKNPATKAQIMTKPRQRKLQAMEIRSDVWFLAAVLVEEKNTLEWIVGLICFGFYLFMGFWGLEVESGTFGEKRKGRTRKKSVFSLSDVLSGLD